MSYFASNKILFNKLCWFVYEKATSVIDCIIFYSGLPYIKARDVKNGKVIVYAGEFLPPRIARLAKWSKKNGNFVTVLLCHKRGFVEKFSNSDIDYTFLFRNPWHLKRIVRSFKDIYVLHGFAPKSKYPYLAKEAYKKKFPGKPFMADYQDVYGIYYGTTPKFNWLKEELPYEKACLAEADGIVAHSLEPCEGMKVWGIKKHCKRLFFPLYADNDYFQPNNKSLPPEDIHLVYAGGIYGSHRDKVHYGYAQFHWLIAMLTEQKIHLHIYPSPSGSKADYEEYEELAKNNSFLHYHTPVSQSKLSEELSKYHYGLMPFFLGTSGHSDLKFQYGTTLKLFNYAEACIPILVAADVVYQAWLVNRYSLGKVVPGKEDFKDVRKLTGYLPYQKQVEKLMENREKLSLGKHIHRLTDFYETLQ